MRRFPRITVLLVLALILSFAAVSYAADAAKTEAKAGAKAAEKKAPPKPVKLKVGDMIKDFSLPDGISKSAVSFDKDIKGKSKVIALSFMTTACSACKAEVSLLSDLTNKYGDDFKAYAVSVDLNGEKSIPAYDKVFGYNVRYLLDPDFKIPQMFGFTYTPGLVIADGNGKIVYLAGGYVPSAADGIVSKVKEIIK